MAYSKYEFGDWMPYEEKYWCTAPEEPGVIETRDASTKEELFKTFTTGGSLLWSLGRKDPNKNFGNLSGYENNLLKVGGD